MAKEFEGVTYLNVIEVAEYSGRSHNTIRQYWKRYGLTPFRLGKELYFSKDQVRKWLMSYSTKGILQKEVA